MKVDQENLYLLSQLVEQVEYRLGQRIALHRVCYLIRTRQIRPRHQIGARRVYDDANVQQVVDAVRAGRRPGSGRPRREKATAQ
ncbi:MAG: hypothetical protein JXB13_01715 [Phycisphaerae bacterium]|nr:hypothetical protein [Phycisphaerae bacterium]